MGAVLLWAVRKRRSTCREISVVAFLLCYVGNFAPISWGRWRQIKKAGLVRSRAGDWPPVVEVSYSPELGLAPEQGLAGVAGDDW
ncbi:MAG: hypothetical protein ACPLQO_00475 [Desulfotomaculales bacterium]